MKKSPYLTSHTTLLATLLLLPAGGLQAQTNDYPRNSREYASPDGRNDRHNTGHEKQSTKETQEFLLKAGRSGMREVELSRAGRAHLKNQEVIAFADRMISDHSQGNARLIELASKRRIALAPFDEKIPDDWTDNDRGADKDYLKEMIEDHENAIKLYQKAASNPDKDIASFANETLPKLRDHLAHAKRLKKQFD